MEIKEDDRIFPHAQWKARNANETNKVLTHAQWKVRTSSDKILPHAQ